MTKKPARREPQRFALWARRRGITKLSRELGVSRGCVANWVHGRRAPRPRYVLDILELAGGEVSVLDLYRIEGPR